MGEARYKLCRVFRRPAYETRENIGAWGTVFDALAVGAVITNALLVGFVGSQMSDALGYHASSRPERLGTFSISGHSYECHLIKRLLRRRRELSAVDSCGGDRACDFALQVRGQDNLA